MTLVAANGLSMHFGGPVLLDGVNVKIERGCRVGLIGPNGSGKSTLLRLIAGQLAPTSGSVTANGAVRIAYQAQELDTSVGATVFEFMQSAFEDEAMRESRLREIEARLADGHDREPSDPLLRTYEALQREQEQSGIYDVERRIKTMLTQLGVPESSWHKDLARFSGGERNVIGLARALLSRPDVLLLDEPSNHLDMDGVEWFIRFIRKMDSAVVMVSHNRHVLDAVAQSIWELRRAKIHAWKGNYSEFVRQREEALALQARQYKVQQRLIQRIEFQARRLRDMANAYDDPAQAKRAKSMLKRIERMEKIEAPTDIKRRFSASVSTSGRHGRIALQINDFSFAYGDRVLFDRASLEIEYGERVCLVGPNGAGKSTLFRAILEQGHWEHPTLRLGKSVIVDEYRQLHDDVVEGGTLEDWLVEASGLQPADARDTLHRFMFTREDLGRAVTTLSGGEKSRLQLARLVSNDVNFLMLDEPTNHLDIEACEQLEDMLQEFEGTLLVISHDRYFLDKLVERVVEVKDLALADHRCSFAEWWQTRREPPRAQALANRNEDREAEKASARAAFEAERTKKRERNRLQSRHRTLEAKIAELEPKVTTLAASLERAYSSNPDRADESPDEILRALEQARADLELCYEEWVELENALAPDGA